MKVTVVHGDYWDGLYFDGQLVWQHHRLTIDNFVQLIQDRLNRTTVSFDYSSIGLDDKQLAYLEEVGELPQKLDDLEDEW